MPPRTNIVPLIKDQLIFLSSRVLWLERGVTLEEQALNAAAGEKGLGRKAGTQDF